MAWWRAEFLPRGAQPRRGRRRSPSRWSQRRGHHGLPPQESRGHEGAPWSAPAPCECRNARAIRAPQEQRATHRDPAPRQRPERPRHERAQRDHASQGSAAGHSVDQASLERSGLGALRARIAVWDSSVDRVQSHRGAAFLAAPRGTHLPIALTPSPSEHGLSRAASVAPSPPPSPRSLPSS